MRPLALYAFGEHGADTVHVVRGCGALEILFDDEMVVGSELEFEFEAGGVLRAAVGFVQEMGQPAGQPTCSGTQGEEGSERVESRQTGSTNRR